MANPTITSSRSFISKPDTAAAAPLPPTAQWWSRVLARLPFAHSVFWLLFFAVFSTWGAPRTFQLPQPFNDDRTSAGGDAWPTSTTASSGDPVEDSSFEALWRWCYAVSFGIATLWMVYGSFKFVLTVVSTFVGVIRVKQCLSVTDWRAKALAFRRARLSASPPPSAGGPSSLEGDFASASSYQAAGLKPVRLVHDADAGAGGRVEGAALLSRCVRGCAEAATAAAAGLAPPYSDDRSTDHTHQNRFHRLHQLDDPEGARRGRVHGENKDGGGGPHDGGDGGEAAALLDFDDVVHCVVIPNYCEPAETLGRTLDTLRDQSVAGSSMVVVLAMEARDPQAHAKAQQLIAAYGPSFLMAFYTVHELKQNTPEGNEVGGKSSNENWAMRCAKVKLVDELGLDPKNVCLTTCDADTYFHPEHFACLSYSFSTDSKRHEKFWQACTNFYPNIHEVPLLCRVRYTLLSVGFLGQLVNPLAHSLPFSVYSLSLSLALEACYWDPTVIPEDWHMYLRCFYATKGRVAVEPLYVPVGCECVVAGEGAYADVAACYKQSQRWQWGAIDVGFILVNNALSSSSSSSSSAPSIDERQQRPHHHQPQQQQQHQEMDESGGSGSDVVAVPHFTRSKLSILLTAYEHHMLYNVMWCALLLAPFIFRHDWGPWRFRCWALFLCLNWFVLVILDGLYRTQLLQRRRHFHSSTTSATPLAPLLSALGSSSSQEEEAVEEGEAGAAAAGAAAGGASARSKAEGTWPALFGVAVNSLGLMLFPLSDLLLFVVPTFHAHAVMALKTESFVYVVAPKGPTPPPTAAPTSTSKLSLSGMPSPFPPAHPSSSYSSSSSSSLSVAMTPKVMNERTALLLTVGAGPRASSSSSSSVVKFPSNLSLSTLAPLSSDSSPTSSSPSSSPPREALLGVCIGDDEEEKGEQVLRGARGAEMKGGGALASPSAYGSVQ